MPNKKDSNIPLPDELGHSFQDTDEVLHFRPNLEWVEPDPVNFDPLLQEDEPVQISDIRDRTQQAIDSFRAIKELSEATQKRIDNRVKALGGMEILLDPKKDQQIIAAMKRRFPNKQDPTKITYDDYRACIDSLNSNADVNLAPTTSDILAAGRDPLRTDFGGYNNKQGQNRPEISSPANTIEPVDLDEFQENGVLALFNMMLPLIRKVLLP